MLEKIKSTAKSIQNRTGEQVLAGIILGTGLGGLSDRLDIHHRIPYEEIEGFPVSTVEGHAGALLFGELEGISVVAMQGRFHYYEGYSMQQIAFPVRVMKFLGISHLFISNACGGVNPDFEVGDLMVINDHINLFPSNPLIGTNDESLGPRFPDMSAPYDAALIRRAFDTAKANDISLKQGVYAGLSGPTLETPSEYAYAHHIGADAVGMSTVPEVIAARHMGLTVFAMSIITDLGVAGKIKFTTHQDVQTVAQDSEPSLTLIFSKLLSSINSPDE